MFHVLKGKSSITLLPTVLVGPYGYIFNLALPVSLPRTDVQVTLLPMLLRSGDHGSLFLSVQLQ